MTFSSNERGEIQKKKEYPILIHNVIHVQSSSDAKPACHAVIILAPIIRQLPCSNIYLIGYPFHAPPIFMHRRVAQNKKKQLYHLLMPKCVCVLKKYNRMASFVRKNKNNYGKKLENWEIRSKSLFLSFTILLRLGEMKDTFFLF